jgi:DNA adenine methylase
MKYMGSKARIGKEISEIINKEITKNNITKYLEPFVGGANLIEYVECDKRYGTDSNEYLIAMWKALQSGWIPPNQMTKVEYENIKDNKDAFPKELVAVAGFCATYNAKWFGGFAGIVTTKINTTRNYYDEAIRNIINQVPKIKNVIFGNVKYQELKLDKLQNYLIYCDPPYENSTKYKDEFDHADFWNWARVVSKNNTVLISEYNAPDDFECLWSKDLTTTLDKNSRKVDTEKLYKYIN